MKTEYACWDLWAEEGVKTRLSFIRSYFFWSFKIVASRFVVGLMASKFYFSGNICDGTSLFPFWCVFPSLVLPRSGNLIISSGWFLLRFWRRTYLGPVFDRRVLLFRRLYFSCSFVVWFSKWLTFMPLGSSDFPCTAALFGDCLLLIFIFYLFSKKKVTVG